VNIKSVACMTALALCAAGLSVGGCQSDGGSYGSSYASDGGLSAEAKAALSQLKAENPAAAALASNAKGILVFPSVVKGGFMVGAFHGTGAMIQNGRTTGYYDTSGGSYGLQAGLQSFSYALFFMSDNDMRYLDKSGGWELGVGPNITVVDKGIARSLTTTTARSGVYCFFFDQKGLMGGLGIQGSKITRIDR